MEVLSHSQIYKTNFGPPNILEETSHLLLKMLSSFPFFSLWRSKGLAPLPEAFHISTERINDQSLIVLVIRLSLIAKDRGFFNKKQFLWYEGNKSEKWGQHPSHSYTPNNNLLNAFLWRADKVMKY